MTKRNKAVLIVLPLLILAGIAIVLFFFDQEGFTGSRVKNPDEYLLDIEKMNGTDLHTLELLRRSGKENHLCGQGNRCELPVCTERL